MIITRRILFLDNICGDYCLQDGETCNCGNRSFTNMESNSEGIYCCNLFPCVLDEEKQSINCTNGTTKTVDEKCYDQCPFSEGK